MFDNFWILNQEQFAPSQDTLATQIKQEQYLDLEPELKQNEILNEQNIMKLLDKATQIYQRDNCYYDIQLKLHRHHNPEVLKILNINSLLQKPIQDSMQQSKNSIEINQGLHFKYDVVFQNIVLLNLGGNYIMSIQPLSQINFPALKTLFLFQNHCISLRPIHKSNLKNLVYFNFPEGQVKSLEGLDRCHIPNFQQIHGYDNQIYFFSELFKLEAKQMSSMTMGDEFQSKKYVKYVDALARKYVECYF